MLPWDIHSSPIWTIEALRRRGCELTSLGVVVSQEVKAMVIEQVHPRHRTLPRQKGGGRGDAGGYDEEAGWVSDVDDSTCAECPERLSVVNVTLG